MVLDINELISVTGPDINEYVTFMCISKLHRALSLNTSPSQEPLIACRKFTNCLAVKKICNLLCFLVFFVVQMSVNLKATVLIENIKMLTKVSQ